MAAWSWRELHRPWFGWSGESVTVELPGGMSADSMVRKLGEARVLRRPGLLRAWLRLSGGDEALHAGEYRFDGPIAPLEVLGRLRRGEVVIYAASRTRLRWSRRSGTPARSRIWTRRPRISKGTCFPTPITSHGARRRNGSCEPSWDVFAR